MTTPKASKEALRKGIAEILIDYDERYSLASITILLDKIEQVVDRYAAEVRGEVLAHFKKFDKEKWRDAEHCSCLPSAIYELEHPEDL